MATTKPVSGALEKNDGATILHAGNIASSRFSNLTLATNTDPNLRYGTEVYEAVSPTDSSNIGTLRPLSNGVFGKMEAGQYVAKILGTRIAQTNNTFLRSGAAQTSIRRLLHYAKGNHRYDISDWSYINGTATKGGNAGDLFTYVDPETGSATAQEPFPTDSVPGKLTYKEPKFLPVQDTYKARTG